MSKRFLVAIQMGGNQIVSPVLNGAVLFGNATDPGTTGNTAGQLFYNTTSNIIKYWNGTGWTPLSTGGTAVTSLNSATGSVTLQGTSNQIAVTTGSSPITLSFPTAGVTLPGKTILTGAITTAASINIPAATATPSSGLVAGDLWTTPSTAANILYYNGTANKTIAFTDSNITGSAGSVANSLTIGNGLTVAGPYNGSAAVTVSLPSTITAGSVGSGTAIPVITYDTYGRITAVSTASISTSISLSGQTGTGSVSTGGTLSIVQGSGITTSVTGSTFTITNAGVLSVNGSTGTITGLATIASPTFTGTVTVPASGIVYPGSTSGQSILAAPATAGTNTAITLPATAGTLALNNQTFYLGSTAITINQGTGTISSITGLSITGNAGTATTLQTTRTINGTSFNGSANITITAANPFALTIGTGLSGTSYDGSSAITIANTGVTSLTGTANQVLVGGTTGSAQTGALTLTLPQSIATTSTPTFAQVTISNSPVNATDVATKAYVDNISAGVNAHDAVRLATTTTLAAVYAAGSTTANPPGDGGTGLGATITFSATGITQLDGANTLALGDRILVKDGVTADAGATSKANGIYVVTTAGTTGVATVLTRATDYDNSNFGDISAGDIVYIKSGTAAGGTQWVQTNIGTATAGSGASLRYCVLVGTDSISFTQFSGVGVITGGTGITVSNNVVSITAINPTSTTDTSTKGIVSALTVNTQGQVTAQTTTTLGAEFTNASGTINIASASIADTKLSTISTAGKVLNSATTATSANTASAIVARDASGNFTAGTITAALTGNASTATTLATPRAINGVNFDGSAAITIKAATTNALTIGTGLTFSGGSTFDGSVAGTLSLSATYTQKYATTFTGGTSANPFTVTHNLNTRDVTVQVYDNTTYDEVEVDIVRTDANNVTVTFATTPTTGNNYRIVVVG